MDGRNWASGVSQIVFFFLTMTRELASVDGPGASNTKDDFIDSFCNAYHWSEVWIYSVTFTHGSPQSLHRTLYFSSPSDQAGKTRSMFFSLTHR
jgi:hypothetical protein